MGRGERGVLFNANMLFEYKNAADEEEKTKAKYRVSAV